MSHMMRFNIFSCLRGQFIIATMSESFVISLSMLHFDCMSTFFFRSTLFRLFTYGQATSMMQNRKAPKPVDRLLSPSDMPLRFHFGGARLIIPKDEDGKRKKSTSTRRQSMNSNVTLDTYSTSGSRSAFTDGFNPRHEESLVFDYVSFEDIPSKRRKHHALTLKDCSSSASSFGNSSLESLAPWHHTLLSTPLDKDRGHILGDFDNKEKTAPMLSPPQQPAIYEKESSSDGDDSEAFYINSGIQLDSPNSATTISVPHCRLLSSSDQRAQLSFLRKIKGGTETDARYVKEGFHSSGDDSSSDSESLGSSTSYDSSDFSEDSYEEVMNDLMGIMGQGKRDSGKSIKLPGSHIPRPVAIGDDHNLCENPMQLFANIRADLEKVGRMIVGESSGEKFIERYVFSLLRSIFTLFSNCLTSVVLAFWLPLINLLPMFLHVFSNTWERKSKAEICENLQIGDRHSCQQIGVQ